MAILSQIDLSAPRSGDKDQDLLFKIASYLYNEYRSAQSVTTGRVSVNGTPFVQLPNLPARSVTIISSVGTLGSSTDIITPASSSDFITIPLNAQISIPVSANANEISVRHSDYSSGTISYVIIN